VARRWQALGRPRRRRPADRRDRSEQIVPGIERIALRRFADERGWFCELRRESVLPSATLQTNVSFSRRGTIRGLHYHERGQDDLFACLQGTARVVVLDRSSGETFTEDIGDENPVAIYIPGIHAHGFEALTDLLFCYHVTREYDPDDPDEQSLAWDDPRVRELWSTQTPILSARDSVASS
jgi:dTDP-4-dehydrorhamnose 3,5-epimerase